MAIYGEGDAYKARIQSIRTSPVCKNQAAYCPLCQVVVAHGPVGSSITIGGKTLAFSNPISSHSCGTKLMQISLASREYVRWESKPKGKGKLMTNIVTQEQIDRLVDLVDRLSKLKREKAEEKNLDVLIRLREEASKLMLEVKCG